MQIWKKPVDGPTQKLKRLTPGLLSWVQSAAWENFTKVFRFACTLAMLFMAIILWIVSSSDATAKTMSRKIVLVTSLILLLWGIDELIFFFPFAAAFSLISFLLTMFALLDARESQV